MRLETERLIIRKPLMSDVADFYEYRSDPRVCEFQGYEPMKREKAQAFIEKLKDLEFGRAGEWIQLFVELKSKKKVIGDIGLKPEAHDARQVEFGVSFSAEFQGKGLAKEALAKTFDQLFADKNIHRITGIMDVENEKMIGLIESLKFCREAEFRESFWDEEKNGWRDEFLYAMLEKNWKNI